MIVMETGRQVLLCRLEVDDGQELVGMNRASREMHRRWVGPPVTMAQFRSFLKRQDGSSHIPAVVRLKSTREIVGVVQLGQIVRGPFKSAYLGYYAGAAQAGRGLMREGVGLMVRHAFRRLRLHRLEANIQPENRRSARLVASLGFLQEGRSRRYLKIAGRWRDHEHWVLLAEEWRPAAPRRPRRAGPRPISR